MRPRLASHGRKSSTGLQSALATRATIVAHPWLATCAKRASTHALCLTWRTSLVGRPTRHGSQRLRLRHRPHGRTARIDRIERTPRSDRLDCLACVDRSIFNRLEYTGRLAVPMQRRFGRIELLSCFDRSTRIRRIGRVYRIACLDHLDATLARSLQAP